MSQWIELDDDDLVCEICEEKETVLPYCVSCVNKHMTLISFFPTAGTTPKAPSCACTKQSAKHTEKHAERAFEQPGWPPDPKSIFWPKKGARRPQEAPRRPQEAPGGQKSPGSSWV